MGDIPPGQADSGGALRLSNAVVTVSECTFRENRAGTWGGAIVILSNSAVAIDGTEFELNRVERDAGGSFSEQFGGGAIHQQFGTQLRVVDSDFVRNVAVGHTSGNDGIGSGDGGATDSDGRTSIANTTFQYNVAFDNGGAIEVNAADAPLVVASSGFFANTAQTGDAIEISSRVAETVSSIFVANNVRIRERADAVRVIAFSTFTNQPSGAALFTDAPSGSDPTFVSNCLFAGASLDPSVAAINTVETDLVETVVTRYPSSGGSWGLGDLDDDFGDLTPLASSVVHETGQVGELLPDAADADGDGNVSEATPLDAYGRSRVLGTAPDIGAVERP